MTAPKRVTVTISVECTATLPHDEVWPDDDAPDDPTEADVMALAKSDLCIRGRSLTGDDVIRLLGEWNLAQHAVLTVSVT